jgi:hypothetical protein
MRSAFEPARVHRSMRIYTGWRNRNVADSWKDRSLSMRRWCASEDAQTVLFRNNSVTRGQVLASIREAVQPIWMQLERLGVSSGNTVTRCSLDSYQTIQELERRARIGPPFLLRSGLMANSESRWRCDLRAFGQGPNSKSTDEPPTRPFE